jgi:hypothetical protein
MWKLKFIPKKLRIEQFWEGMGEGGMERGWLVVMREDG